MAVRGFLRLPRGLALVGAVLSAGAAGCAAGAGGGSAKLAGRATPAASDVSDAAFAAAVHDLLITDAGSRERSVRLGAVETRQMARAALRFKKRTGERGLAALTGGLYLVRVGEATPATFGERGPEALAYGIRELAARGDEGRVRAMYDLLLQSAPEPERVDIRGHLRALDAWTRGEASTGGSVSSAGAIERVAVRRRLLEPTASAMSDAVNATTEWIQRALALRDKFRKTRVQPPREEGIEAWRALETGPLVLIALYLRDGDPAGALAAVDRVQARELLESSRPQLASALEGAAQERTAARCAELLTQVRPLLARDRGRDEEDVEDDRDVYGAAAFGLATACYRQDPTAPMVAISVVVALDELGMAEASPAVLVDALRAHPDAGFASEALGLALTAMSTEEEAGDADAARRAFLAAQPLLALASQKALFGKLHPSPAQLRAAMGEIELREGRLDAARLLLVQAVAEERLGGVLLALARIDWRDGQIERALAHLREGLAAPDAADVPALRGDLLLTMSDVQRDAGDAAAARATLASALKVLTSAREASADQGGDERARTERVLARVLARFGAPQAAQRALDRAYSAAPGDKRQAAQTLELVVGSALVRGDLTAARDGLSRALAVDLDPDDLVYFAVWVHLLEEQLRAQKDGTPDRVFASVPDDGRWSSTLARFGEGKLKGDDLIARAASPVEKYEALFYAAMARKAAGDAKASEALLRQVVSGTGLELSEVTLAREILDTVRPPVGPLPTDVVVP